MARKPKEYAVYRGDEFICIGTAKECEEKTGIKANTIRWHASKIGYERSMRYNKEDTLFVLSLE